MTLKEIFEYYFSLNLSEYSSIGIDFPINLFLVAFLIGMLVTIVVVNLLRTVNTQIVKKLLRYEAISEDSAKTIEELQLNNNLTRLTLSGNGRIKRIIKRVGEKEYTYEEFNEQIKSKEYKEFKIDFRNSKFYIFNECIDEAKKIAETKNSSILNTILLCLFITIVFLCVIFCMPEILNFINNSLAK